jgi:hypothetical protein
MSTSERFLKRRSDGAEFSLKDAVLAYISECDNPAPDYAHRRTLRNYLRKLVDAPPEPTRDNSSR